MTLPQSLQDIKDKLQSKPVPLKVRASVASQDNAMDIMGHTTDAIRARGGKTADVNAYMNCVMSHTYEELCAYSIEMLEPLRDEQTDIEMSLRELQLFQEVGENLLTRLSQEYKEDLNGVIDRLIENLHYELDKTTEN